MTKTTLLKSEGRNIQTAVKFPETASSVSKSAQREVVNVSKPAFQPCTFQQGHRQLIGTDIAGCNLSSLKEEAVCSPRTLKDSSCPLLQSVKIVAPSRDCSVSQLDVSEVAHFPKTICPDPVGNIVHFETVPELLSPPVPAPRAARAQRSPPPVSVPRVGGAGVQLVPAPIPVSAGGSGEPIQQFFSCSGGSGGLAQSPSKPPSLQPLLQSLAQSSLPPQSAPLPVAQSSAPLPVAQSLPQPHLLQPLLKSIAQSVAQLVAQSLALSSVQAPVLSPIQSATHLHPQPGVSITSGPESRPAGSSSEPIQHVAAPTSLSVSAGSSGELFQPSVSAEGSEGPVQLPVSAGGPRRPVQAFSVLAGGSGEPSQHQALSAGGSGEPGQHQATLAGGSGEPPLSRPLVGHHGRRGRPPERGHHRRWPRGGPPDLLCHCSWPRGRPPDLLCCRNCLSRGRPPELFWLLFCRPPGRPPELFMDLLRSGLVLF
ncbi:flocculation protein FLO11-like [Simochromis diagramma]|uniref:flocculation protein FLO11-like n=1 Tax=Simochromis diagramma TaxID=43689 RepID=UPI001A7E3BCE|nr:flocculation protein FLO11-like [Simochromis diagramma]